MSDKDPITAGEALLAVTFDTVFAEKMKAIEPGKYAKPGDAAAAVYAEILLGLIHRDDIIIPKAAIIGASTVAGVMSDVLDGPALTRACLEAVRHGALGVYRERLKASSQTPGS